MIKRTSLRGIRRESSRLIGTLAGIEQREERVIRRRQATLRVVGKEGETRK